MKRIEDSISTSFKLVGIVLLVLSSLHVFGQKCPNEGDIKIIVKSPCENKNNGQIEFKLSYDIDGNQKSDFGLYRIDIMNFERNRIYNSDLEIKNNTVIYKNIPEGVYQLAIYEYGCPGFPRPILLPENGVDVKNDPDCNE